MLDLTSITPDIYRLKVSFSDIYTSVFVIRAPGGTVLFDTATTARDAENYIAPALEQLGMQPDYVFISHNHNDHSGGLARVLELYPEAKVVTSNRELQEAYGEKVQRPGDGQLLFGALQAVFLPGHTPDAIALLDTRTGTLLSGDCLQAYGVYGAGSWGSAICSMGAHFQAIEKLRTMDIQTIVTAHDYHPYKAVVEQQEVGPFLDTCVGALLEVRDIIAANPTLDEEQLVALCNTRGLPRITHRVIAGIRMAIDEGIM